MGKTIGIDLGTTNSLAAHMTPGGPVVVRDAAGSALVLGARHGHSDFPGGQVSRTPGAC